MIIVPEFRWCPITSWSWFLSAFYLNFFKFWYPSCMIKYSLSSTRMIWYNISSNFWQWWHLFIVSWTWSKTCISIKSFRFWIWITNCWKFRSKFWVGIYFRILILARSWICILWLNCLAFIYYFGLRSQWIWRWFW